MYKTCVVKNYKILIKEMKIIDGKTYSVYRLKGNILKISILPILIYRFNLISTKIPARFSVDIDKIVQIFIWKRKGNRIVKIILKKKNKVGGINLPNFKTC